MVLARLASAGTATKLASPRVAGFEAWAFLLDQEILRIRNSAFWGSLTITGPGSW
jgi:hypothetical protein